MVLAAGVGLAGGALLPRPAYRFAVPWREPADGEPRSPVRDACDRCGRELAAGVPGWLSARDRCVGCAARLGPPRVLLAPAGGLVAAGLAWRVGPHPELVAYLFGALLCLLLGTVDALSQRLPDRLVYPGIAVSAALFALAALADGDFRSLGRAVAAAVVLFGAYVLLAVVPGANIGLGDLGLAALLGLYLGWLSWPVVIAGAALPWVLQAGASLVVVARGRADRTTMLAFGPAMLAGAYLVLVVLPGAMALFLR